MTQVILESFLSSAGLLSTPVSKLSFPYTSILCFIISEDQTFEQSIQPYMFLTKLLSEVC